MAKIKVALLAVAGTIAGCSGSGANQSTIDLLRAGDPKVCVAGDVEGSLRKLVLPKDDNAPGYTISFSGTTLESFDKTVKKAMCHTEIKIDGPNDTLVEPTGFDFTIVPSAQDTDAPRVTASLEAFAERLSAALSNDQAHRNQAEEQEADEARLRATVKEGWLKGRWVDQGAGSNACTEGGYVEFGPRHRFETSDGTTGNWSVTNELAIKILSPQRAVDWDVTEADQNSFTMTVGTDGPSSFRRCAASEITAPAGDEIEEEEDTSGIDASNPIQTPQ